MEGFVALPLTISKSGVQSSCSIVSNCEIFSLTFRASLWGSVIRSFIFALSIAMADLSSRMASSACCFVFLCDLTEKWASFSALSTTPTVYGLLVSGLTHLSATIVAMSLNIVSSCVCLSFSDTWSSPFARIFKTQHRLKLIQTILEWSYFLTCKQTSVVLSVPKTRTRSSLLATWPLETLVNTVCVCNTSSISFSLINRKH